MNRAASRILTVSVAVTVGIATLGCGFLSQAKQAVENVSAVGELADKLGKSQSLTFTADYKLTDGSTATVAQQPPKAAFIGKSGRFILTETALYMCSTDNSKITCQKQPYNSSGGPSADQAGYMTAVAGGGFISTPMAIALLTAAAIVPGVKTDKSTKTIAGVDSTCMHVSNIPQDNQNAGDVSAKEFTVCVGNNGVLTEFTGVGTDDKKLGVTLAKFSDKTDAKSFLPPAGAKIVDVTELTPPAGK